MCFWTTGRRSQPAPSQNAFENEVRGWNQTESAAPVGQQTYTCTSSAQVDQNSGGFVDLTAVVNSTAGQHHRHAFPHLCRVVTLIYCLKRPERQDVATTALQKGEHGGRSALRTALTSSSSSD